MLNCYIVKLFNFSNTLILLMNTCYSFLSIPYFNEFRIWALVPLYIYTLIPNVIKLSKMNNEYRTLNIECRIKFINTNTKYVKCEKFHYSSFVNQYSIFYNLFNFRLYHNIER